MRSICFNFCCSVVSESSHNLHSEATKLHTVPEKASTEKAKVTRPPPGSLVSYIVCLCLWYLKQSTTSPTIGCNTLHFRSPRIPLHSHRIQDPHSPQTSISLSKRSYSPRKRGYASSTSQAPFFLLARRSVAQVAELTKPTSRFHADNTTPTADTAFRQGRQMLRESCLNGHYRMEGITLRRRIRHLRGK